MKGDSQCQPQMSTCPCIHTHRDAHMCRYEYIYMHTPYTHIFIYIQRIQKYAFKTLEPCFKCGTVFTLDTAAQPLWKVKSICAFWLLLNVQRSQDASHLVIQKKIRNFTVTLLPSFPFLNTSQWSWRAGTQTLIQEAAQVYPSGVLRAVGLNGANTHDHVPLSTLAPPSKHLSSWWWLIVMSSNPGATR